MSTDPQLELLPYRCIGRYSSLQTMVKGGDTGTPPDPLSPSQNREYPGRIIPAEEDVRAGRNSNEDGLLVGLNCCELTLSRSKQPVVNY